MRSRLVSDKPKKLVSAPTPLVPHVGDPVLVLDTAREFATGGEVPSRCIGKTAVVKRISESKSAVLLTAPVNGWLHIENISLDITARTGPSPRMRDEMLPAAPEEHAGKVYDSELDVVYMCRPGENEELRYSLRSIAANLPHAKVWIFGACPRWVRGVHLVETDQTRSKQKNGLTSIRAICEHEGVSERFILMNDDFFIMEPLPDGVPALNYGLIVDVYANYRARGIDSNYTGRMWRTKETIEQRYGVEHPLSYELHVPMIFERTKLATVIPREVGLQWRSLYGNAFDVGGERVTDCKVYARKQRIPRGPFLSSMDEAFGVVRPVLDYFFYDPCCYEAGSKC